jgi:hypothetical protein
VSGSLTLVWDERLTGYDFGPGHPLAPVRVELTIALAREFGLLDRPDVTVTAPAPAEMAELELVHDASYIDAVRQAGQDGLPNGRYGLGTPDNPVFADMHEASALVAGATLAAARAVWRGETGHAANIAGGLHHAMRRSASGFCIYNDPAIAIRWMLAQGVQRIAYVDVDVHHGDGVQAAFYDDPRVLTISLHEHPATLFPGTGLASEIGSGEGRGYAVNVALPAFTGDAGWGRSTRWCRRCCGRSGPRCSSASTAATATGSTRWPTSSSAWTHSGAPSSCCTTWRTRWRAASGCSPGAADTSWCRSCPGRGRTCSPWPPATRSNRRHWSLRPGGRWRPRGPAKTRPPG